MSNKFTSKILLIASLWLSSMAAVTTFTACSDDSDEPGATDVQSTGVTNPNWDGNVELAPKGSTANITFTAAGDWTIVNNSDWLTLSQTSGKAGNAVVMATAKANDGDNLRETFLTINVKGYSKATTIKIVQDIDGGTATGVNAWIRDYMESHYLWNEPIPSLKISNSLNAEQYLNAILDGVDAQGHLNHDDGHWTGGKRDYYYSWVEATNARSRAVAEQATGSGIMYMDATRLSQYGNEVGLIASIVCPGSPAAQLGMRRGSLVTAINGMPITSTNYVQMADKLYDGDVTITWEQVTFDSEGYIQRASQGDTKLGRATFNDPSVYVSKILEFDNGPKVGYMLYNAFDYGYDNQLINAFKTYKEAGITDLVLDLRYNSGGHVISSLLMGTLIAGQQNKGKVYGRSVYNATRLQTTSPGEYKLGEAVTPEMPNGYDKITEGLQSCVNLKTIYIICSEFTASASELVINGLRGVDVDVRLVGLPTNGKNCGMEGIEKTFGNLTYSLYPITFYIENAKGFKDYSDGFIPDVNYDDSPFYPGDFGSTNDIYSLLSFMWIVNGTKPDPNALFGTNSRATVNRFTRVPLANNRINQRRVKGAMMLPKE